MRSYEHGLRYNKLCGKKIMFISIKKYIEIWNAIITLAKRPYLSQIIENPDGTVTFEFVQGEKIYRYLAVKEEIEERILN